MSIKTSFIIPHKGREGCGDTIQSIADLDTPKTEFEVIIVSQNDRVSELIHSYNKTLNLSVIYNNEERTISHSRHREEQAQGEYLAFLDADVVNQFVAKHNDRNNNLEAKHGSSECHAGK